MNTLSAGGRPIALDPEGYLVHLDDWNEAVARALAEREGLELQPGHWEIIGLLRDFYQQFQLSPATRPLVKYTAQQLGTEKGNSLYLNHLFRGTPAKLAAKLAGLPKPRNCL